MYVYCEGGYFEEIFEWNKHWILRKGVIFGRVCSNISQLSEEVNCFSDD